MKNLHLKTVFFLLLLTSLSLFGVKALFHPGYFTSHDGWHQVVRLYYFSESIKQGIFPPSYIRDLFYGYGYPLFIFSYHLPWMVAQVFIQLGFSVFDSIKAVYVVGYILSGFTMFWWLKHRFGNWEAFIGSSLYLWAPYRFSNIFVRGATGEATVFIFIPLFFLAIDLARQKFRWKTIVIGSIAIAGIILSHAIVGFLILGIGAVYTGLQVIFTKNKLKFIFQFLLCVLFGLLLSAYYLVPSLVYRSATKFNERFQLKYDGQFATLKELIYSKWGYGFSTPRLPDSMSFQVGIAQWITVALTVLLILFLVFKKQKIKDRGFVFGLIAIFVIAIILILPQSVIFWSFLAKILFSIDFPWRLLLITVFASSALAAYLISNLPNKLKFLLSFLLIATALYTNRNHLGINQYTDVPLDLYLLSERTTNTYDEYLPIKANGNEAEKLKKGSSVETTVKSEVSDIQKTVTGISFRYTSETPPEFTVHLFYFPGWEVFIDNSKILFSINDLGLIKFKAMPGQHEVRIKYSGTFITEFSKIISLVTLFLLFIFLLKEKNIKQ